MGTDREQIYAIMPHKFYVIQAKPFKLYNTDRLLMPNADSIDWSVPGTLHLDDILCL